VKASSSSAAAVKRSSGSCSTARCNSSRDTVAINWCSIRLPFYLADRPQRGCPHNPPQCRGRRRTVSTGRRQHQVSHGAPHPIDLLRSSVELWQCLNDLHTTVVPPPVQYPTHGHHGQRGVTSGGEAPVAKDAAVVRGCEDRVADGSPTFFAGSLEGGRRNVIRFIRLGGVRAGIAWLRLVVRLL